MGRRIVSRRGGLQAPKRQIANDGIDDHNSATLTFLATAEAEASFEFGALVSIAATTLVRTRGMLSLQLTASGGALNQISGAFGMIVVSQAAFITGGITALPVPMDDLENDWFVYVPFSLMSVGSGTQDGASPGRFLNIPFDSRGQRKLKDGDVMAPIIQAKQVNATTGTVILAGVAFRQQFKL